jgi:hypothetical protein
MTLETLQARFSVHMKHTAGLLFEVGHNKVDSITFKLVMSNLATAHTSWAKDLNLDAPRGTKGDRVNRLATDQGLGSESAENDANFVGSDKPCKFYNIPGHTAGDYQLFINFLMASRFAKQNPHLVGFTLEKHITSMRICPSGRGRPVNNYEMGPSSDDIELVHEATTPEGGQVIQFDANGLVCHLTDDSVLYQYKFENESLHSCPFAAPIIHIEEYEHPFIPYMDDYLVVHVGEAASDGVSYEYAARAIEAAHATLEVNWMLTSNIPPT